MRKIALAVLASTAASVLIATGIPGHSVAKPSAGGSGSGRNFCGWTVLNASANGENGIKTLAEVGSNEPIRSVVIRRKFANPHFLNGFNGSRAGSYTGPLLDSGHAFEKIESWWTGYGRVEVQAQATIVTTKGEVCNTPNVTVFVQVAALLSDD